MNESAPSYSGPLTAYLIEADPSLLAETMVAFANSDGGTIILGVDQAGIPTSDPIHGEELAAALQSAQQRCRPIIHTGWEQHDHEGGTAFAIRVPRSAELHSVDDGRVLVRLGRDNHPLGGEQIRQLAATKSSGELEAEPVSGATREDLDERVISEYLDKRRSRERRPLTDNPDEILTQIGALTKEGVPTVSGILLFGRKPQVLLPQSGLVFIKFDGSEARGEDGAVGYGRREEVIGPVARIIEEAWQIINEEMAVGAVVKDLERQEIPEYPPFAVREALVNSVCHRDYRLRGRRIEVRMFSDRLEVISPGGLPGFVTVDNIVEEHFSRNPRLVSGVFQWGYIEELGLGIDRMIEAMVQDGHPPPAFRSQPHAFSVTLHNTRDRRAIPSWERNMNERQIRALTYIRDQGSITNREYRKLCQDLSPETLRLDLAALVNQGVLLKIGAKKGTYYILK